MIVASAIHVVVVVRLVCAGLVLLLVPKTHSTLAFAKTTKHCSRDGCCS